MNEPVRVSLQSHGLQAGVPTLNGNVYSREVIERMVDDINARSSSRSFFGTIGSWPDAGCVGVLDASHLVLGARLSEDGRLTLDVEVLDTPKGKMLKDMLSDMSRVDILPHGYGSVSCGSVGTDYKLVSFDIAEKKDTGNSAQ